MKKRWKILSTIAVGTLLLTGMLTGCGKNAAANNPASQQSGAKETAATEAVEETTIRFIHWRSEDADVYKKLISNFEEINSNIKVEMEITSADENEYYSLIKSRLAGSEGLDVFTIHPGDDLLEFQKAGKLMDLTDLPATGKYEESLLDSCKVDGKIYGLAQAYNTQCIYYNKGIFQENGLEVPKNWNDMLNIIKVLKDKGIEPISAGFAEQWVHNIPFIQIVSAYFPDDPNVLHKLETGEMKLTDKEMKDVFAAYQEMGKQGFFISTAAGVKYDASVTLFGQGQAAMLCNGTWAIGSLKQQDPELEFGFFYLPTPVGMPIAQTSPAQALAISADTKNEAACKKFIEYLSSNEAATLYSNVTIQNSGVNGLTLELQEVNDVSALIDSTETSTLAYHLCLENTKVSDVCLKTMVRALNGEDINKITEQGQAEIESALQ